MRAVSVADALLGRGADSPEARQVTEYLRITVVVALGMLVGAVLQWVPPDPSPWRWLPLGIAYVVGGYRIVLASWQGFLQRRLSIDFLMGAAALGAAGVGEPLEGAILIFLFSLSNLLESYAMGRTRGAIARLMELSPEEATLADAAGRPAGSVAVAELEPGQAILIRPGERVAADGRVRSGQAQVDQAAITGESTPVTKRPGDEVYAGTINQTGSMVVEVTRRSEETTLARIVRLVEEAREQRAPAQHFVDRFAHPYTLGVVAATALVATIPVVALGAPWADAFYRAMTLLVVASPCALVISTPSAILSGIANGARHGVLFKGGAYLDLAGTIDTIAFDKTGTLTEGRPRLRDILSEAELRGEAAARAVQGAEPEFERTPRAGEGAGRRAESAGTVFGDVVAPGPVAGGAGSGAGRDGAPLDDDAVLALAAAVEQDSEHHLARAILEAARERGIEPPAAEDFSSVPGAGVAARVDGRLAWAGNATMAERMNARLGALIRGWTAEHTSLGRSVVYVGGEDRVVGAMAFGDTLKPTAGATIRHLKYEGIRHVAILSGDHPEVARAIGAELGVDEVRAGLLPDRKVEAVREMAAGSRGIAMVGDGVNDSPAMAVATLGIAMGAAGTDVAIETADVVLMGDELEKVDYVVHLGKRSRRVVRQNVIFSVGWMFALVIVALTVGIPLTLAVVAHEGSTLLVVANGLRLLGGRPHPPVVPERPRRRLAGASGNRTHPRGF